MVGISGECVIFVINHRREIKELEKLMKECLDKNDVG
jgi:hypothetical protein